MLLLGNSVLQPSAQSRSVYEGASIPHLCKSSTFFILARDLTALTPAAPPTAAHSVQLITRTRAHALPEPPLTASACFLSDGTPLGFPSPCPGHDAVLALIKAPLARTLLSGLS